MNLLEYVRTPGKYNIETTPAKLQVQQTPARLQASTQPSQLNQRQTHAKVRTDTVEMRNSMGFKTSAAFMEDAAARGRQAALEAIRAYTEFGNSIKNFHKGANIPDALFQRQMQRAQGELVLMPLSPVDIRWQGGEVETQFLPQSTQYQFQPAEISMEFVPGSLRFEVAQYPALNFRFLGQPVYVPPSAAPQTE